MPAYVIVETDIQDAEQYARYMAESPAAVAAGGGRFLVRGGELAVFEGDWAPSRLVVLEFDDLEAAKHWYASARYQEVKRLREGAARLRMVAVEGVPAPAEEGERDRETSTNAQVEGAVGQPWPGNR
jgi:uncharacterized protein (DUF1330 family)